MRCKKRERLQIADAHLNCEKKLETESYNYRYIKAVIITKNLRERLSFREIILKTINDKIKNEQLRGKSVLVIGDLSKCKIRLKIAC